MSTWSDNLTILYSVRVFAAQKVVSSKRMSMRVARNIWDETLHRTKETAFKSIAFQRGYNQKGGEIAVLQKCAEKSVPWVIANKKSSHLIELRCTPFDCTSRVGVVTALNFSKRVSNGSRIISTWNSRTGPKMPKKTVFDISGHFHLLELRKYPLLQTFVLAWPFLSSSWNFLSIGIKIYQFSAVMWLLTSHHTSIAGLDRIL